MLNKLKTVLKERHFWRKATYSELSALYVFKVIRLLAMNLGTLFIIVYIFKATNSVLYVAVYLTYYCLLCFLFTPLAGVLTALLGAKKVLLISGFFYILTMVIFSFIQKFGENMIIVGGLLQSIGVELYQVAHDILFSEIKSSENAGKEIGYMAIFEKICAILGPLAGGFISAYLKPELTLILASLLFLISTIPLFRAEGTSKKNHYFNLKGFPFRTFRKEFIFQISTGFETSAKNIWPIFMLIVVFPNDNPYLVIGKVTALSAFICLFIAYGIGKLMDNSRGGSRMLFHLSSIGNAFSILWRAFIGSSSGVIMNLIYNDAMVTAQNITSLRAHFDSADRSGSRVVYLTLRHFFWNIFCFISALIFVIILLVINNDVTAMKLFLIMSAVMSSLYGLSGYKIYKKQ